MAKVCFEYNERALCRAAHPLEFDDAGVFRVPHAAVTAEILAGQHPIRAWEYSQALRALEAWIHTQPAVGPHDPYHFCDVGGAGSRFWAALIQHTSEDIERVDPALLTGQETDDAGQYINWPLPLGQYARYAVHERKRVFDAVFCLSVLEHVGSGPEDFGTVLQFLSDLRSLVRPGGLLVLTCDMGEREPDTYHFRWMRTWIPTPEVLASLVEEARVHYGFRPVGTVDYTYHGPTVYDYTVASVALVREP